jgi:hypothetical protein
MIDCNLDNPVHVKMTDALQLTMFAAGAIELLRMKHPAASCEGEASFTKYAIDDLLDAIPALIERVDISVDDAGGDIKCPVTGKVMHEAGIDDRLSFVTSDAYIGEIDNVELDCVSFKNVELDAAWAHFIEALPPYDDYPDLIRLFVVYNYHLFQYDDLLMVVTEHQAAGHMVTYTLLNKAYLD